MRYQHQQIDINFYINSLYSDGLKKSKFLDEKTINKTISNIGIFKFKGYVKAFRDKLSLYSIDDILYLYNFDRALSINLFHLVSEIEIKLKSYLVEVVYELSKNPFSYLVKHNYKNDFTLAKDSLYTWEVKINSTKAELYLHYRDYYLGRYDYDLNYQEYLKNEELIKLHTVLFLLQKEKEIFNSNDLEDKFVADNFKNENSKMKEFILSCMRKR